MNCTGGPIYADQAAAEHRLSEVKAYYVALIDELERMNESIDSAKLAGLLDEQRSMVDSINF